MVHTHDQQLVRVSLIVDAKRRDRPTPDQSARSKARQRAVELAAGQALNASRDVRVEVCGGGWIALVEERDRVDDVGDRFFGVGDLQRPSAASMIWRARLASTTRPWRYDSSAASMPASSSGVSVGASSSTASTTYRPAGSSRSSAGMSLPFHVTTFAVRLMSAILAPRTDRVVTVTWLDRLREFYRGLPRSTAETRSALTALQRTSFRRSEESVCAQPANSFLAIHRASLARCGPSTSDPATAPSNSTIRARAVAFASFTPAAVVHSRKRSANHSR